MVKWNSYVVFLLITTIGTIPFTLISMTQYFWSAPSTLTEGINAIVYMMIWLCCSFIMGAIQNKKFYIFSLIYFLFVLTSSLIAYISFFYVPIVAVLAGPFNGLEYFLKGDLNLYIIGPILNLLLITLGY